MTEEHSFHVQMLIWAVWARERKEQNTSLNELLLLLVKKTVGEQRHEVKMQEKKKSRHEKIYTKQQIRLPQRKDSTWS